MNRRTASAKVRNAVMNHFASYEVFKENRKKSEEARSSENRPHEILYFHKVDDPYSHLTIQFIDRFRSSYNIQFKPILVGEENPETVHEPSLYNIYCLEDVRRIAPYYDVSFSAHSYPSKDLTTKANRILSAVQEANFGEVGKEVSAALWSADEACLDALLKEYSVSEKDAQQKIRDGNSIRDEKDYYFGSAFYYENELYWGVDRLHYLERRLSELKLGRANEFTPTCKPRLVAPSTLSSSKQFKLTYYPSLNSPYTFVSTKRVRQLQENYPINLITKPVLPMLMRMMTIPTFKAKYIISDAAREGRTHQHEIKKIYLNIPREKLLKNIYLRTEKMFKDNCEKEVKKFNLLKLKKSYSGNKLIGIKEINDFLKKTISLDQCKNLINIRTRQYAKRQNTWARGHMKNWNKLYTEDSSDLLKKILKVVS